MRALVIYLVVIATLRILGMCFLLAFAEYPRTIRCTAGSDVLTLVISLALVAAGLVVLFG
jgi:hypothetical protein